MGIVYRATQLSLGRPVALKLIAPEHAGRPGLPRALPARVADGRGDRSPERHPRLRRGRGGRAALPRHALGRRHRPAPRCCARAGALGAERGGAHRRPGRAARSTPRTRPGSSTATSSPPTSCSAATTPTWPTSGSRAMVDAETRLTTQRASCSAPSTTWRPSSSRAERGRRARRRLRARLRALRRADRRAAVPARHRPRDDARAPARPAAAAVAARRARGVRPRARPRAGQGAGGPLPVGGRPRPRRAGRRRGRAR